MRLLSKVRKNSYLFFMRPYQTNSMSEWIQVSVGRAGLYQCELSLCVTGATHAGMPLQTTKSDFQLFDPEIVNNTYLALMSSFYAPVASRLIEIQDGKNYVGNLNYYGVEGVAPGAQPTAYVLLTLYLVD